LIADTIMIAVVCLIDVQKQQSKRKTMNKSILRLGLLGLLAAGITGTSANLRAQNTNAPAPEKKEHKAKPAGILPFHGNLKAVDATAKTISVGDLVLQITSETKIEKAGKAAALQDGVVGEPVGGSYKKTEDGKLTAVSVHFGPKEGKPHPKKKLTEGENK
jgi:hypothetical protein